MKLNKRKTLSPIEVIKKKVSGIVFSDKINPQKSKLTIKEFNKIAEEVKQTFKNDYFARPQLSF